MTDLVERFTVESLLRPQSQVRVMVPELRAVDVHWHDFYELSLVVSGEAEHVVNGVRHSLVAGSAFLLSPGDFHEIQASGTLPLLCYNVVIDSVSMERQLDRLGDLTVSDFPWLVEDFSDLEPDFRRLRHEFDDPTRGSTALADALVTCLVIEMARQSEQSADATPPPAEIRSIPAKQPGLTDDIRRAVHYLDRHFRQPLSLATAAQHAHLSPNYFSERFRAEVGTSFQSYLLGRRLSFARSLLGSTALAVTEVCHAAGFNDLSYFGRAYRRRYGESPSARREPV